MENNWSVIEKKFTIDGLDWIGLICWLLNRILKGKEERSGKRMWTELKQERRDNCSSSWRYYHTTPPPPLCLIWLLNHCVVIHRWEKCISWTKLKNLLSSSFGSDNDGIGQSGNEEDWLIEPNPHRLRAILNQEVEEFEKSQERMTESGQVCGDCWANWRDCGHTLLICTTYIDAIS